MSNPFYFRHFESDLFFANLKPKLLSLLLLLLYLFLSLLYLSLMLKGKFYFEHLELTPSLKSASLFICFKQFFKNKNNLEKTVFLPLRRSENWRFAKLDLKIRFFLFCYETAKKTSSGRHL